jgi:L-rhamnose isomerase
MSTNIEKSFSLARERYAKLGVNVEAALKALARIPISLHCWQGDDVGGFENFGVTLGGGLVPRAIIPARPARRMNYARTWKKPMR